MHSNRSKTLLLLEPDDDFYANLRRALTETAEAVEALGSFGDWVYDLVHKAALKIVKQFIFTPQFIFTAQFILISLPSDITPRKWRLDHTSGELLTRYGECLSREKKKEEKKERLVGNFILKRELATNGKFPQNVMSEFDGESQSQSQLYSAH